MQQQIGAPKPDLQTVIQKRPEQVRPSRQKPRLSGYRIARLSIFLILIGFWIGLFRMVF